MVDSEQLGEVFKAGPCGGKRQDASIEHSHVPATYRHFTDLQNDSAALLISPLTSKNTIIRQSQSRCECSFDSSE